MDHITQTRALPRPTTTLAAALLASLSLSLVACGGESPPATDLDAGRAPGDGGPRTFDAGPPETCDVPGSVESVACGACGTTERFCTAAGVWAYGVCDAEGTCEPGTTSEVACGACGTQMSRCTASCEWEAIGECGGEGMCRPGTRTRSGEGCAAGETREVLCTDTCGYEPAGECESNECDSPGALETVACGMCGTQQRFCTAAGAWEYDECSGGGACVPGTTETAACGACGTERRRCTAECAWESTGACMDEGECAPGSMTRTASGCPSGQTRLVRCDDACTYAEVEGCMAMPMTCTPACAAGETCRSTDGTCRCGAGAACGAGERCVSGSCMPDATCTEGALYGCRLASPQCGCAGGQTCDVDRSARRRVCRLPGTQTEGQACSDTSSCATGLACYAGACHRWCNGDADCSGAGSRCLLERLDSSGDPLPFPANLCTIACNPITSAGCAATDACEIRSSTSMSGTMAATDCRPVTELPLPFGCFENSFCPRGQACVGTECQRHCRVGVPADCSGTCTPLPGMPRIGSATYGTCTP